ncbi:hypothetical protein SAMN05421505_12575 [Sinosporangium album]|uniref:Uncharacterized protein n=1 Tax=Sinosporangium album TaxID=504805 RepID=A0A1G8G479_9ACTN|nr:hypothetical protein [Sinosporangium album]SDH89056.1 hypothetical protein SAMN05421505_12575 [Sinosporangium album]
MRHFVGLLIGLVVTAATLVGGGWAMAEVVAAGSGTGPSARLATGLGVMAAVGLLLGVVVASRISPVASFVPSMVLLSWTVVYALDATRAVSFVPTEASVHQVLVTAGQADLAMLRSGVFALLGVLLFMPVLIPSRWSPSRRDGDEDEGSAEGAYY